MSCSLEFCRWCFEKIRARPKTWRFGNDASPRQCKILRSSTFVVESAGCSPVAPHASECPAAVDAFEIVRQIILSGGRFHIVYGVNTNRAEFLRARCNFATTLSHLRYQRAPARQ